MSYKINNILFEDYGMLPGRVKGEAIAVKGLFDMPSRIGDTHYDWAEGDGVEPYVENEDINLGGRDITLAFLIKGTRVDIDANLVKIKKDLSNITKVVPLETPYGNACVLVKKITPKYYQGGATINILCREPNVGASCGVAVPDEELTVYESEEYSETAQKNNCDEGYYGSDVELTSPAGKFTSIISQSAANQLAIDWVREQKQTYANAQGTCIVNPPVYYNELLIDSLQKNDCENGLVGTTVTYEVPAYTHSSLISQEDADAKAQAELDANLTQEYANENGVCGVQFWNELITHTVQKNDCPDGYEGSTQTFNVPANLFSSFLSQGDANQQARNSIDEELMQNLANSQGTCIFIQPSKVTYKGVYGSSNFRYMQWSIDNVNDDATYTFIAYGVAVEYTAQTGDTIADVTEGLINVINNTSLTTWRSENQMPFSYAKPQALLGFNSNILNIAYYNTSMRLYVKDN